RTEVLKWKGKNYKVPKVLLSGNHAKIESWKSAKLARSAIEGKSSSSFGLRKSKKYHVPKVLLGGNHKKIEEWKTSRTINT
ncbi:MAG: hypothetical protein AAB869_03265, partial [Patescibacteria group bacterium]